METFADELTRLRAQGDGYKASLLECLEYFEKFEDVVDGDDGQPEPNKEAKLAAMIRKDLGIA